MEIGDIAVNQFWAVKSRSRVKGRMILCRVTGKKLVGHVPGIRVINYSKAGTEADRRVIIPLEDVPYFLNIHKKIRRKHAEEIKEILEHRSSRDREALDRAEMLALEAPACRRRKTARALERDRRVLENRNHWLRVERVSLNRIPMNRAGLTPPPTVMTQHEVKVLMDAVESIFKMDEEIEVLEKKREEVDQKISEWRAFQKEALNKLWMSLREKLPEQESGNDDDNREQDNDGILHGDTQPEVGGGSVGRNGTGVEAAQPV